MEYDLSYAMNGGLSGLVAITANCCVVKPYYACVIGVVAGWMYIACSKLLVSLRIDDAVDAVPVHLGNGIWGCIATGIFAHPDLVLSVYGSPGAGIIYGKVNLLLVELIGVGFILGWVGAVMMPYFTMLKVMGLFRVDPLEEEVGLDISHHKGAAYDLQAADDGKVDEFNESRSKHGKAPVERQISMRTANMSSEKQRASHTFGSASLPANDGAQAQFATPNINVDKTAEGDDGSIEQADSEMA